MFFKINIITSRNLLLKIIFKSKNISNHFINAFIDNLLLSCTHSEFRSSKIKFRISWKRIISL